MLLIILAALLPAIILFYYTYSKDPIKEPSRELRRAFLYGVLSAPASLLISVPLTYIGIVPVEASSFMDHVTVAFMGAAVPEEIAKYLMLILLMRRCSSFDEYYDGIMYAVCIGLGFAAFENIEYLFGNIYDWVGVSVQRALFAVPAHFFFALIMGYFFAMAKFGPMPQRQRSKALALLVPILAHGIYDAILMVSSINELISLVGTVIFLVFFVRLARRSTATIQELIAKDAAEPYGPADDQGYSA